MDPLIKSQRALPWACSAVVFHWSPSRFRPRSSQLARARWMEAICAGDTHPGRSPSGVQPIGHELPGRVREFLGLRPEAAGQRLSALDVGVAVALRLSRPSGRPPRPTVRRSARGIRGWLGAGFRHRLGGLDRCDQQIGGRGDGGERGRPGGSGGSVCNLCASWQTLRLRPSLSAAGFQGVAGVTTSPSHIGNVVLRCRSMPAIAASDIIPASCGLSRTKALASSSLRWSRARSPRRPPPHLRRMCRTRSPPTAMDRSAGSVPVPAPAAPPVARGKGRSGKAPRQTGGTLTATAGEHAAAATKPRHQKTRQEGRITSAAATKSGSR